MKKHQKRTMGIIGLTVVALITVFAFFLPSVDTSALGSADVKVQVTVYSNQVNANFITPLDGMQTVQKLTPVTLVYSKAHKVSYKLVHTDGSGHSTEYNLPDFIPAGTLPASGTHNFNLDLSLYGGFGTFVLHSTATGTLGDVSEDSVSFRRLPAIAHYDGEEPNHDPIIDLEYSAEVCSAEIQAFHKSTNTPLFDPAITFTVPTPRPANNHSKITLPFAAHHAKPGDYRIKIIAFSCQSPSSPLNGPILLDLSGYASGPNLEVPNTGGISFAGLNFARSDYLTLGIAGFFTLSTVSLYVLATKKKRSS